MWRPEAEATPLEQLAELQRLRLSALLRRLARQVPFYRSALAQSGVMPRGVQDLTALRHLPFTTKRDLRDQYPFGLLGVRPERVIRLHATSGTRGKPTLVAYTRQDLRAWAEVCARMLHAAGCRAGEPWYIASGYGLFTGGLGAHQGAELIGATVVPASSGNTARLLQLMQDVRPAGIHCIPSYMLRIAEVAEAAGIEPRSLGLRHGSFGGETWSEPLRQRIEAVFGLTACDVYGLSECWGPGVAYECPAREGLHVNEDHFLVEVIDPVTGQPVGLGEEGELVITTLTKEAMPLLRYRTGDLTCWLPDPCPCGRTFRRIARIRGRCDDMLTVRGVNLYPSEVERILLAIPSVGPEYRLVVGRTGALDELRLEVECGQEEPAALDALEGKIRRRLRQSIGLNVSVSLKPPGTIPRPEGKARRVVDARSSG